MQVIEKIAGLFNAYILIMILIIGLFTLLKDVTRLRRRQYSKEIKIARFIGFFYIFGGLISYLAFKILL